MWADQSLNYHPTNTIFCFKYQYQHHNLSITIKINTERQSDRENMVQPLHSTAPASHCKHQCFLIYYLMCLALDHFQSILLGCTTLCFSTAFLGMHRLCLDFRALSTNSVGTLCGIQSTHALNHCQSISCDSLWSSCRR